MPRRRAPRAVPRPPRPAVRPAAVAPTRFAPSCATWLPWPSQERLPLTAVGGHGVDDLASVDDGELVEVLGELARLGVPEPHAVSHREAPGGAARHGRLHLAGHLARLECEPFGPHRARRA